MTKIKAILIRTSDNESQTLGTFNMFDGDKVIFSCKTLELPYRNNAKGASCIPLGKYKVVGRTSPKYGNHFHVLDVENRDYILFHQGNFNYQIRGCILVGSSFKDINNDGEKDVINSKNTLSKMTGLTNEFELTIIKLN